MDQIQYAVLRAMTPRVVMPYFFDLGTAWRWIRANRFGKLRIAMTGSSRP